MTDRRIGNNGSHTMAYEPSPEAILEACLEIQGEWTEAVRLSRAGFEKRPRSEALKFWLGRFAEIEVG